MNIKKQPQDRQQVLIDLYTKYLMNEISMGQLLAYLRKNLLSMSQEQYATLVGISRRTLSDISKIKENLLNLLLIKCLNPLD